MKGIFTLSLLAFLLTGLTGCYTIPQHFTEDEEEYPDGYYEPLPYDPYPEPGPIYSPPIIITDPNPQQIIRTPEPTIDRNGYENQVRDPLRGNHDRGNDERIPEPISNSVKKDRGRS